MGSIEPYTTAKGRRYRVRYRDLDRQSRERGGFLRKADAEVYLASVTVGAMRGEYLDPSAGKITIEEAGNAWLRTRTHLKPSSLRPIEIAWRVHVLPEWGRRRLSDVQHSDVQRWVSNLHSSGDVVRSATTVIRAHGVLASILDVAVKDHRIPSNPARGARLPRRQKKRRSYLNHQQVELLARLSRENGVLVHLLAYTGIRWGEAVGLRSRAVDVDARRITIEENAVDVGGSIHVGTPKTHQRRRVPIPDFLAEELSARIEGLRSDELVFGRHGTHMRRPDQRRGWFVSALIKARELDETFPRVTLHDLRHTAASLSVSAGANVKAVQRMLGHASAAMTLDVYADLFDDDLTAVSQRLDAERSRALGDTTGS